MSALCAAPRAPWAPLTHPPAPTTTLPQRDALRRVLHPVVIPDDAAPRSPHGDHLTPIDVPPRYTGRLGTLGRRLVAIGGGRPCFEHGEPDLAKLLSRGQVFGPRCRLALGVPNQCHANSAAFLMQFGDDFPTHIATGYALCDTGIWHQHSWLIAKPDQRWTVIETTRRRLLYYGTILTPTEATLFSRNNFL